MSLSDSKNREYLQEYLKTHQFELNRVDFEVEASIRNQNSSKSETGSNYYAVVDARKGFSQECFVVAFDADNAFDVAAVVQFLEVHLTNHSTLQ